MKNLRAVGVRLGGVLKATRAYYAFVPLAIPLLIFSVSDGKAPATPLDPPSFNKPPIDFLAALEAPAAPLPTHQGYLVVERGDTLDVLLEACGLGRPEASYLVEAFSRSVDPRSLKPGQVIRYEKEADGSTRSVELMVKGWGSVRAERDPAQLGQFAVQSVQAPATSVETVVTGEIESSLWEAVTRTGESPQLVPLLVDVFQWDVDFFQLQRGDRFSLIAEKKYVGTDFVGYGPVRAARFEQKGDLYEAFWFEARAGEGGYYTRGGTPVRKQFLKSPVKFSRITSGYTKRRYHPVLKTFRPHYGVDYGAPVGTPVMSTADGVVTFAGRGKGEGNWIRIRHSSRMETAYLHLSKFASGIRKGTRVKQGDVIAYVGMTGLSSGPHLDYRVRDGGSWINPLKVKSITPDPLRGDALRRFRAAVDERLPRLGGEQTLVAGK